MANSDQDALRTQRYTKSLMKIQLFSSRNPSFKILINHQNAQCGRRHLLGFSTLTVSRWEIYADSQKIPF
jgi:hypothetical protein